MCEKPKKAEGPEPAGEPAKPETNDIPLHSRGDVVVIHQESAAKAPPQKRIHPRRPLPPVPESRGEAVPRRAVRKTKPIRKASAANRGRGTTATNAMLEANPAASGARVAAARLVETLGWQKSPNARSPADRLVAAKRRPAARWCDYARGLAARTD